MIHKFCWILYTCFPIQIDLLKFPQKIFCKFKGITIEFSFYFSYNPLFQQVFRHTFYIQPYYPSTKPTLLQVPKHTIDTYNLYLSCYPHFFCISYTFLLSSLIINFLSRPHIHIFATINTAPFINSTGCLKKTQPFWS